MEKIKEIECELTSIDFPLNIIPKWDTFTNLDESMKNKVVHTVLTLVDILKGYKSNLANPNNRLSWDHAKAGFNSFEIVHVDGMKKYEFKLELKNKILQFKADFKIFLFTGSSIECPKSFRVAMEELL
jgi:hypothetical protein